MNFALSDEQILLREAARGSLSRYKTVEAARAALETPGALPDLWPSGSSTAGDQLRFDEWLARAAHGLGLAALQKNDPGQARRLEPYFDGVLDELAAR